MSVKPEFVENLGEANLQPGLPLNEGEVELLVFGNPHPPPTRRGSSVEPEREVIPNNDETDVEFVFRILGDKILELAILDGPVGRSSPSRELALCYRLVSRDWRDTINSIYRTACLPLFKYRRPLPPENMVAVERTMRNIKSLASLFAAESDACSAVMPPVSLGFTLSCATIPLETKTELEATALNTFRQMGRMLLTLKLQLPHNSLEGMNLSSLDLQNLKHAEFQFYNPNDSTPCARAPWTIVEAILKAATSLQTLSISNCLEDRVTAEMPELPLSKSMETLVLGWIRIPMWLIDIAPTLTNMRILSLSMREERLSGQEQPGHMENLLISKVSKYLDVLELEEDLGGEEENLASRSDLSKPTFSIMKPMPKLRTLNLSNSSWKLGELRSYNELLPSLTHLEVSLYSDKVHFPGSWYASPCSTLRRLRLLIYEGPSETSPLSQQVLGTISRSFPNLNELYLKSDKCADNTWQPIFCQGFPNLRKLEMECSNVSAEGRSRLVAAVSGIPLEELQAIWQDEKELEQVINNYHNVPSLRDLTNLQELKLNVSGRDEDDDGNFWRVRTDSNVMIYSTFLRMPNLKKVVLNPIFRITEELLQHARNETGLVIRIF